MLNYEFVSFFNFTVGPKPSVLAFERTSHDTITNGEKRINSKHVV